MTTMLPTSVRVRRQRAINIACAQDKDEREQAVRQAEDDNIIDAALAALLLQAIQQDSNARDEAAREARSLHVHVFNAPKKQCVRRDIQTPEFASWDHFDINNNGSDQSWFHWLGLSKSPLNLCWSCAKSPGVATQLSTSMVWHVLRESLALQL
jgi:hypothetical protein